MGIVFDIQKFCVYDGPGIRTSVFMKGCMMRCPWCHNPESLHPEPELSCDFSKCVSCGACAAACPVQAHHITEDGQHKIDFQKCIACGKCVQECPVGCLKIFGREMTARQVMDEVVKDRKYFASSGGGVTFTGGEPTFQFPFLMELLTTAKEEQLHVCLETNGVVPYDRLQQLAPMVDIFLLDYKATGEAHRRLTGIPEERVLETLAELNRMGKPVILRCPVIQGINDNEEHFAAIRTLRKQYACIRDAEIMAYHSSGLHKWKSLGVDYTLEELQSASPEMKHDWETRIRVE